MTSDDIIASYVWVCRAHGMLHVEVRGSRWAEEPILSVCKSLWAELLPLLVESHVAAQLAARNAPQSASQCPSSGTPAMG